MKNGRFEDPMKNMKLNFGFRAIAVGAFALTLGLVACGDGGSTNGASNDDDSSSSRVILNSSSSVISDTDSESPSSSSEKDDSSSSVAPSSSSVILSSSSEESSSGVSVVDPATVVMGTLIDARDDQVYKTVTIGSQTWMAENLNYDDGNGGHCYKLDNAWCEKNGRLYPWHEAMKACPSGWHLPSDDEWITLWTAVGGDSVAGAKLKSTDGWNEGGNGSDSFGFAVLPAGCFDYDIYFDGEGSYANYWSSSETDGHYPVFWYFSNVDDGVYDDVYDESHGLSVRCLKD